MHIRSKLDRYGKCIERSYLNIIFPVNRTCSLSNEEKPPKIQFHVDIWNFPFPKWKVSVIIAQLLFSERVSMAYANFNERNKELAQVPLLKTAWEGSSGPKISKMWKFSKWIAN